MLLQITKDLGGNVNGLKFERPCILDITGLGEDLEHGRSEPPSGRFVPLGHVGITPSAIDEVILPKLVGERRGECSVLLSYHEIEEVTKEWTMLHGSGKTCVGGDRADRVLDEPPQVRFHQFQPLADQPPEPDSRSGISGLYMSASPLPPATPDHRPPEATGRPRFRLSRRFQRSGSDVSMVTHNRHPLDRGHQPLVKTSIYLFWAVRTRATTGPKCKSATKLGPVSTPR